MNRPKRFLVILSYLLSVVTASFLVFVGINLIDEDLNPSVKPLLEIPSMTVAPERNGYLYLLGFNVAIDKDPHPAGAEIEKIVQAHYRDLGSWLETPKIYAHLLGSGSPALYGVLTKICDPKKQPCLERYIAESAKIDTLAKTHARILERYQRLMDFPEYEGRALYSLSDVLPLYGDVSAASQILVARAVVQGAAGQHQEAAKVISNDIQFWRKVLGGSKQLLEKMVASNRILMDLKLLNELVARSPEFAQSQTSILAEITQPLTEREAMFCTVSRNEWASVFRHVYALGQAPWTYRKEIRALGMMLGSTKAKLVASIAPVGFAPNATLNLMNDFSLAAAPICEAKPANLPGIVTETDSRIAVLIQKRAEGITMFYNPIGKELVKESSPGFLEYRYRVVDLDGYMRATALHLRLLAAGVNDDAILELISKAGPAYNDPYTDKPIVWNSATRTLAVTQYASYNKKAGAAAVIQFGKRMTAAKN